MKKRIKIQGLLIFSAAAISIILAKFLFRSPLDPAWDRSLDAIGVALFFLGFIFRIAARGYKAQTSQESKRLVTDGPYMLARNPMYFGTVLIGTGVILALFVWWVFFLFLAVILLIYVPQVRREEAVLRQRFGKDYEEYCKAVPRFLPALKKVNLHECLSFRASWAKKEISSFCVALVFLIALKIWKGSEPLVFVFLVICFLALTPVLFYAEESLAEKS